ncbi:uncharacterized protein LOC130775344 [Actinidia eriantha]|uniref:uncharacterized protein LOC130775344 n=1 Tax=Actinidia eriantha TaxID=165200 RepID=UPI00258C8E72|nr:uncharacterized protein LOC130775344 [Actinidia eriantha]
MSRVNYLGNTSPSATNSLVGAIALLITLRLGGASRPYDGIVLHCAVCGISDKFKTSWPLKYLFPDVVPTLRVILTPTSIPDVSGSGGWRKGTRGTMRYIMWVCTELQLRFEGVNVPFLIAHVGGDVLCQPEEVEECHRRASSKDFSDDVASAIR